MSEQQSAFPRRDDDGRIRFLGDLLGVSLGGVVIGMLVLVLFDTAFAWFGAGDFGQANGWLAVILAVWLFWEDFRAWEFGAPRLVAGLVALAMAVVSGLLVAGVVTGLPPLLSGGLAAVTFTVVYTLVWFPGVRWLVDRTI
ncbi:MULTISPECIES: hypothetical protein [unclassified Micromonospora]|uniref:hypothetical protein n=1 Tax=unclassified Micromonospora TaxID=2617518 RepID=UPI0010332F62|nr:hypothetical protein [Verrucosispora sp. SN26_14.1]TBL36623.1 hypothetical protein EYA84_11705 [Verrucosispora sp. SN26_14.1]